MRRTLVQLAVLIILLGTLAACGASSSGSTTVPAPTAAGQPQTTAAPVSTPAETATEQPQTTAVPVDATAETTETADAATTATTDYGRTLTIMTHDSFNASADVITEFEQANKINLRFLKSGDAGSALNKAILAKGNPLADVLYGVDNAFFSRAVNSGIFEPYKPAALAQIPAELQLDPEGRLTPIDYGFVNFNYDKAAFGDGKLPVPQTLRDLTKPEYKGKVVVTSPATSSPGLAFLLTTIATFGEDGDYPWTQFWTDMLANDVQVVDSWETAYYTNFSGSSGQGPQPIVLSYATSPAAEVYFSEGKLTEPPTANLLPDKGAFRQIEFAGILQGTKNLELAQRWIDYMVDTRFQSDIPLSMFVYPANPQATQPEVFQKFAAVPSEPAVIAPEEIAAKRDQWIEQWTRIMQH